MVVDKFRSVQKIRTRSQYQVKYICNLWLLLLDFTYWTRFASVKTIADAQHKEDNATFQQREKNYLNI